MDKTFELQGVLFEWDEEKYASNLWKHRIRFEEATEVFADRFNIFGDASVEEERREYVLGVSYSMRLLLVICVERGARTRIISARKANSQEANDYAEQF